MPESDIAKNYAAIDEASGKFIQCFGPTFTNTPEGHIQTDIAGAAAIAGLVLLRATKIDLTKLAPGTVVLSDVHATQDKLFRFMANVAYSMGIEHKSWNTPVPKEHSPRLQVLQMTQALEPPFIDICRESTLPADLYPHIAALTAMKLVAAGDSMKLLDAQIGKAIALYHVIAGSKTVPSPLSNCA